MLSLWNVASLTMVAFWSFLNVEDFLLLPSSSIQTPGASRHVQFAYFTDFFCACRDYSIDFSSICNFVRGTLFARRRSLLCFCCS